MKGQLNREEQIAFTAYKEQLRRHDAVMQERAPHAIALDHQRQLLQELSEHKITDSQDAKINSRKKHALQAAIARTESALRDIG
jgi:hypothetical protein